MSMDILSLVRWFDIALALAVTLCALALYPFWVAAVLTVGIGGALLALAGLVRNGRAEGYILQGVLFSFLLFPVVWVGWPFGLVPLAVVLGAWLDRPARHRFGLASSTEGAGRPLILMAVALFYMLLAFWIYQQGWPLYGGFTSGFIASLSGRSGVQAQTIVLVVVAVGLCFRQRWAYLLAPAAAVPALLSVHPLGRWAIPLFVLWPHPAVRSSCGLDRLGPWRLVAIVVPPAVGLMLLVRWIPTGFCPRHHHPMGFYHWHEATYITGRAPRGEAMPFQWDAVKVTCALCEAAASFRAEQDKCLETRLLLGGRPSQSFQCPFDLALRSALAGERFPPNHFEQLAHPRRLHLRCQTCFRYGLPRPED
ncbi:MAG: hypothetical protein HY815_19910 [Candidatus Riflebacteria bacterium]|nr:hypothetical protein [Candidatus Riflebacteria bacterium]